MRIGYGYRRGDRDFAKANVEKLFLDTRATKRSERADMLHALGLRPGDVVVVVFERDLGSPRELGPIRQFIADAGAYIETFGVANGTKKKPTEDRGIPYDAAILAQKWWHAPGISIDWINDKLVEKGFGPYARHQFIYALGNRGADPRVLTKPENG